MNPRQSYAPAGRFDYLTALLISLVFGLQFGLYFGVSNHNTYLLHGLRLLDSSILSADWLAAHTTDYHPYFSYLVSLLLSMGRSGWAFVAANVLAVTVGGFLVFCIIRLVNGVAGAVQVFLFVMVVASLTDTNSVADSYIFSELFQPSTLGAVGFIGAIYFFIRGQYLFSGLCHAIGGLFHANFLVLGFPAFFIAHLLLSRKLILSHLVAQFAFSSLALIPFINILLSIGGGQSAGDAARILIKIRSPHHYDPTYFYQGFLPFLGWVLIGWQSAITFDRRSTFTKRAISILLSTLFLVIVVSAVTSIIYWPKLAQLYFWRLAPFVALIMQILLAVRIAAPADSANAPPKFTVLQFLLLGVGLALLSVHFIRHTSYSLPIFLGAVLGLYFISRRSEMMTMRLAKFGGLRTILIVFWLFASVYPATQAIRKPSFLLLPSRSEQTLYEWARSTLLKSVFLIPPELSNFRLHTERAIIGDWKSTPFVPDELVEWYRRMEDISGIPRVTSREQASAGYRNMTVARLEELKRKYAFDYAVLKRPVSSADFAPWITAFENKSYKVIRPDN